MNLAPLNITRILKDHNLHPKKQLGQNFLVDTHALQRVIEAAEIEPGDEVLEIGPGLGSLTRLLAVTARQVTAVEIDDQLIPVLKEVLTPFSNVKVIQGDILKLDISKLITTESYIVVANIPYYITSAVLRHLLGSHPRPDRMVLTIQREVAERICARDAKMSLLSLSVHIYGKPSIASRIPAGCFYPVPDVESSVIKIDLYPDPAIPPRLLDTFFVLAHAGFAQKRKTLRNSLSAGLSISADKAAHLLEISGIDPQRRAETLSISEWEKLSRAYDQKA